MKKDPDINSSLCRPVFARICRIVSTCCSGRSAESAHSRPLCSLMAAMIAAAFMKLARADNSKYLPYLSLRPLDPVASPSH